MAPYPQVSGDVDDTVPKEYKESKDIQPPTSDTDASERPVRKKLSETKITSSKNSNPQTTTTADGDDTTANPATEQTEKESTSRASSRGRKRSLSHDEEDTPAGTATGHRRKRSRDSDPATPGEGERDAAGQAEGGEEAEKLLSPKKKRSREDEPKIGGVAEKIEGTEAVEDPGKAAVKGEPEKKRHRDLSQERDTAETKPTSAFANTSTVSPFGALGSPKKPTDEQSKENTTSSSAFASSSLAAFAGSEQSPFGSIGGASTSVFSKPADDKSDKTAGKGFAADEGPSPFASASTGTSAFGGLGSGFGGFAAAGKSGGLTSFASPGGPSVLGNTSKTKPFGAPEDDEDKEKEGKEEATESGPGEFEQDKTDERFFEQEIETGEEQEKTYFSSKAKLFQFSDKEWRERGVGTFKVNRKQKDDEDEDIPPRLIMRADGVLRVMLNTPIFKGMAVGDPQCNEPKSKQIHLASLESGRSVPILLRMPNNDLAKELYHVVRGFLDKM